MRAITQIAFGDAAAALRVSPTPCVPPRPFTPDSDPIQLTSVPRPSPKANEVLLRVLASSVNALDVRMVSGYGR